ncbi:MAG: FkbM family methyltransferase [Desulfobacteraceae bacterium]|nr:MAG: FkbM family methyltransferase [Desulfobacteraceae bacterium]
MSGATGHIKRFYKVLSSIYHTADHRTFFAYIIAICFSLPEIIAKRSLGPADRKVHLANCCFTPFNRRIFLSSAFFDLAREIYCEKTYFLPGNFFIPENGTVVDIGANVGVFTILAALHSRKVIAIEGQSEFIPIIKDNLAKNGCMEEVHIEFGLIGAGSGVFADTAKIQAASHYGMAPPHLQIEEIINRYGVEKIDFMKIDIEGSEFDLFKGNVHWLEKVCKIAMEIHQEFGDGRTIVKTLQDNGFRVSIANNSKRFVAELHDPIGYLFAEK